MVRVYSQPGQFGSSSLGGLFGDPKVANLYLITFVTALLQLLCTFTCILFRLKSKNLNLKVSLSVPWSYTLK